MIIVITSLKGGVGKTTTAMHLAAYAAERGQTATVLDADPEGSAASWSRIAAGAGDPLPFAVDRADRNTLSRQARNLEQRGVVIIDTPPNDREILRASAYLAEHVLVPLKPTGMDVERLMPTLELLRDVTASRGSLDVALLFTHWDARRILSREAVEALEGYPVLDAKVRSLARYEQAFGTKPAHLEEFGQVWEELM